MGNRSNDDLARALEGLAAGEHAEPAETHDDHDHVAPHHDVVPVEPPAKTGNPPTPRRPMPPAPRSAQPSSKPPPLPPSRPAAPGPASSLARSASPTPVPKTAPAASARPTRPTAPAPLRGAAPAGATRSRDPGPPSSSAHPPAPARPVRPSAPGKSHPAPGAPSASVEQSIPVPNEGLKSSGPTTAWQVDESTSNAGYDESEAGENEEQYVADDDDAVIVPPPPIGALGHQHAPPAHHLHLPTIQSISLRQTTIPILLTAGIMLALFSVFKPMAPEASILGIVPMWICLGALGVGLVLIGLAVLNMLLIGQQIKTQAETAKSSGSKTMPGR